MHVPDRSPARPQSSQCPRDQEPPQNDGAAQEEASAPQPDMFPSLSSPSAHSGLRRCPRPDPGQGEKERPAGRLAEPSVARRVPDGSLRRRATSGGDFDESGKNGSAGDVVGAFAVRKVGERGYGDDRGCLHDLARTLSRPSSTRSGSHYNRSVFLRGHRRGVAGCGECEAGTITRTRREPCRAGRARTRR